MEITSAQSKCRQCELRAAGDLREPGAAGCAGSPSSRDTAARTGSASGTRSWWNSSASALRASTVDWNDGPNASTCPSPSTSRSRTDTDSPGATSSNEYQAAALVPGSDVVTALSGTTWHDVASPRTTCRSMPSLVYPVGFSAAPNSAISLVSLSVTISAGAPSTCSVYRPSFPCSVTIRCQPSALDAVSDGLRSSRPHAQVLRNHSWGSRCSGAGSGPWLVAVISTHRSVGPALA